MSSKYIVELFKSKHHSTTDFTCGTEDLDNYIKKIASQDTKRNIASVYVMCEDGNSSVVGYYTLSAYTLQLSGLPEEDTKKLPRYEQLPANLIGRLAVDSKSQGQNLGQKLLLDALLRAYKHRTDIAALAVLVDAKDKKVVGFYERFGFKKMVGEPLKLYILMDTIGTLYPEKEEK